MKELEVDLEPVDLGSTMFFKNGRHIHSATAIRKNFTRIHRLIEFLKLDGLYARSAGFCILFCKNIELALSRHLSRFFI